MVRLGPVARHRHRRQKHLPAGLFRPRTSAATLAGLTVFVLGRSCCFANCCSAVHSFESADTAGVVIGASAGSTAQPSGFHIEHDDVRACTTTKDSAFLL